jgi:hypothetical protein
VIRERRHRREGGLEDGGGSAPAGLTARYSAGRAGGVAFCEGEAWERAGAWDGIPQEGGAQGARCVPSDSPSPSGTLGPGRTLHSPLSPGRGKCHGGRLAPGFGRIRHRLRPTRAMWSGMVSLAPRGAAAFVPPPADAGDPGRAPRRRRGARLGQRRPATTGRSASRTRCDAAVRGRARVRGRWRPPEGETAGAADGHRAG